ncbi:MAG: hypothetical protein AAF609_08485 [Cyanobacteria bacterium P01_C01_bin.120]
MIPTNTVPETGQRRDRLNETAFPLADHGEFLGTGLTKRELFAAMAMQGLLTSQSYFESNLDLAHAAVERADALIDALNPKHKPEFENIPWKADS